MTYTEILDRRYGTRAGEQTEYGSSHEDEALAALLRHKENRPDAASLYFLPRGVEHFVSVLGTCQVNSAQVLDVSQSGTVGSITAGELQATIRKAAEQLIARTQWLDPTTETAARDKSLQLIRKELDELAALGSDWDGHGAAAISWDACQYAWDFVQALPPHLLSDFEPFPEPDGSVGLEYHRGAAWSLYLSFSPGGEISYVAVRRDRWKGEEVHRGTGIKAEKGIPQPIRRLLNAIA